MYESDTINNSTSKATYLTFTFTTQYISELNYLSVSLGKTRISNGEYSAVVAHVDMIIASKSKAGMHKIVQELKCAFIIEELGEPQFIFGIEGTRDRTKKTLALS